MGFSVQSEKPMYTIEAVIDSNDSVYKMKTVLEADFIEKTGVSDLSLMY